MWTLLLVALYGSLAVLVVGLFLKLRAWLRRPLPPGVLLAPAPRTRAGAIRRVAAEAVLFRSLYRASRWTWLFAMSFHLALALTFLGHLRWLVLPEFELAWLQAPVLALLLFGLGGLLARRLLVDRLRYISTASDYAWLALLTALALTGGWLGVGEASSALRAWLLGQGPLPQGAAVISHVLLAAAVFAALPFSKMLHAPGVLLQPARAGVDARRR